MSISKIPLSLKPDHIRNGFVWEVEPSCKCGSLKKAFDANVIFVSNFFDEDSNLCYMFILDKDGYVWKSDGTTINYCPWCGDKIKVRKKNKDTE